MILERQAAEMSNTQPTRSILLRSAAWLALNVGDATEAARLADAGLDPDVPERIRNELLAVAVEAACILAGRAERCGCLSAPRDRTPRALEGIR